MMKYRLMDLLACPMCKTFPLKLTIFEEYSIEPPHKIMKCELFCAYHGNFIKELENTNCHECYSKEIQYGILECPSCGRWYPIEEDIPRMLPDELRKAEEDIDFLKKWKDKISENILKYGRPINLSSEEIVKQR